MTFEEQIPLAQFTAFKIGGPARYFCRISSEDALVEAIRMAHGKKLPLFVLGGGSNILLSDAGFAGVVMKMEERGRTPASGAGGPLPQVPARAGRQSATPVRPSRSGERGASGAGTR